MAKDDESPGCTLALMPFVFPAMALYGVWAEAFVLQKLWAWHAVPLGAPALAIAPFAAFAAAWSLVKLRGPRNEPADTRTPTGKAIEWIGYFAWPWTMLFVGWLFR